MGTGNESTRLDTVMKLLEVSAKRLSTLCWVSNSLISRWQNGSRPLTNRSTAFEPLVEALLNLDTDNRLDPLLAPWRTNGENKRTALSKYLIDETLPALPAREKPPQIQRSGNYITQQQVLLGAKGFRRGALLMLDYVLHLPPGQTVIVCAHSSLNLWHNDLVFAIQFLIKLRSSLKRKTCFRLINRRSMELHGSPYFSVFWLTAHLKGIIRSRYYEGEPPAEHFVGAIPGYWSGCAEPDETAEDGLAATLYTDPRNIRKNEIHCQTYLDKSAPAGQYGFLCDPLGNQDNQQLWQPGPLPAWSEPNAPMPDGCFSVICRVPSFGIMTCNEYAEILQNHPSPPIPDFLFSTDGYFVNGQHRIILCREDVREGLLLTRRRNEPLSELLHRDVYISRSLLADQLERLLAAMKTNESFEVALMPRSAFKKLELELICWQNSVSIGWLQNGEESMLDNNPITAVSFTSAVDYVWSRLLKGWKRRRNVTETLNKWLAGQELEVSQEDSALVKNWELLSKK